MKYTKPATRNSVVLLNFLDSLPAEFEIVEPGMTQVKWPCECTKGHLEIAARNLSYNAETSEGVAKHMLRALAAIAPVEKKKRTISVWESGGHLIAVRDNPNLDSQVVVGWRKVGECEVDT